MKYCLIIICLCGCILIPAMVAAQPRPGEMYDSYLAEGNRALYAKDYPNAENSFQFAYNESCRGGMSLRARLAPLRLLAGVYRAQQKNADAEKTCLLMLQLLEEGKDSSGLAGVSIQLAQLRQDMKKTLEAEQALTQGIEMVETLDGKESPALLPLLNALAARCRDAGQEQQVKNIYQRALDILTHAKWLDELALAEQATLTAESFYRGKQFAQTADLCRQTAARLQQRPQATPFPLVNILSLLARCEDNLKQSEQALQHYRQAVTALDEFFGPESPSLVRNYARIAAAHQEAGRDAEADTLLQRALAVAKAIYKDSEETAKILDQYAGLQKKLGKTAAADKAAAEAKAIREPKK